MEPRRGIRCLFRRRELLHKFLKLPFHCGKIGSENRFHLSEARLKFFNMICQAPQVLMILVNHTLDVADPRVVGCDCLHGGMAIILDALKVCIHASIVLSLLAHSILDADESSHPISYTILNVTCIMFTICFPAFSLS